VLARRLQAAYSTGPLQAVVIGRCRTLCSLDGSKLSCKVAAGALYSLDGKLLCPTVTDALCLLDGRLLSCLVATDALRLLDGSNLSTWPLQTRCAR